MSLARNFVCRSVGRSVGRSVASVFCLGLRTEHLHPDKNRTVVAS